MQRIPALRFSWVAVSGFLLAAAIFLPAVRLEAQAAGSSEFSQSVKEVYFPFNVYNKAVNPSVLEADAAMAQTALRREFLDSGLRGRSR